MNRVSDSAGSGSHRFRLPVPVQVLVFPAILEDVYEDECFQIQVFPIFYRETDLLNKKSISGLKKNRKNTGKKPEQSAENANLPRIKPEDSF